MTEISRRQFAVYLVAVVVVVLLGGRALRADAGPAAPGAVPAGGFSATGHEVNGVGTQDGASAGGGTGASGARGALEVASPTERVLVHIAGAVRRPGVYELGAGARIADALERAGGGRATADLDALNLAAKVSDGQQVLVARRGNGTRAGAAPTSGAPPGGAVPGPGIASGAGSGSAGGTVNVNQADVTQLEQLPGVGPAIAAKIVDWRTQNGPFRTVDDLAQVPGIGPKKLEALRAQAAT